MADEACEEAEEVVVESEKPKDNPKTELRLLMEECKRLQAESSKYKNLYDQIKVSFLKMILCCTHFSHIHLFKEQL